MLLRIIRHNSWRLRSVCMQSTRAIRWNLPSQAFATQTTSILDERERIGTKFRTMDPNIEVRADPVVVKLNSPEFKAIFSKNLCQLVDIFSKYNYEIRIAGGAVRDLLMQKQPSDLDFATTATPCQMVEMFTQEKIRMFNMNGVTHGTVTARINDEENFEITTLRIDVKTDGRRAEVEFTKDWLMDASRRDLTINSMFLGLDGSVYDWFYGYEHLQQRRVMFVGVASKRIQEDYLRILRYFRFYGRIAEKPDGHDADTLATITENIEGLQKISGERIWAELQKILRGNFALELLEVMLKCQMAKYIGLSDTVDHDEIHRLRQVMYTTFHGIDFHPVTLLASQLNELVDAADLQARLKMSAYERDLTSFLANNKYTSNFGDLLSYQKIIILGSLSAPPPVIKEYVLELLKYQDKRELHDQLKDWVIPRMPISGSRLTEHGVPAGKSMGHVIHKLKEIWCEHQFKISTDQLLTHVPGVLSQLEQIKKTSPILNKTIRKKKK